MNTNEPVTGHRTQIYLPISLYKQVKEKAQQEDISIAQFIRKIIEEEVEKKKTKQNQDKEKAWEKLFAMAGFIKSEPGDLSINHDKYLAEDEVSSWRRKKSKR